MFPGDEAIFKTRATLTGMRVLVVSQRLQSRPTHLATAIERDPALSFGAWHVARMAHRVRMMCADSEARAESWIGSLGDSWCAEQGHGSGLIMTRLQLRVAGVHGNGCDDDVVHEVVNSLDARPLVRKGWSRRKEKTETAGYTSIERRLGACPDSSGVLRFAPVVTRAVQKKSVTEWRRLAHAYERVYDHQPLPAADTDHLRRLKVPAARRGFILHTRMTKRAQRLLGTAAGSVLRSLKRKHLESHASHNVAPKTISSHRHRIQPHSGGSGGVNYPSSDFSMTSVFGRFLPTELHTCLERWAGGFGTPRTAASD